jgi:hypothetical protein
MNRRGIGFGFLALAVAIFISRFITAAIYGSGHTTWNRELFSALLDYVDQGLTVAMVIMIVLGVGYLVLAEINERRNAA